MNRVERISGECPAPAAFARRYLGLVAEVLASLSEAEIAAFIETLIAARERDARIFFIGNGGSAATASHFANDIAIGTRSWTRPFRAVSLTDNVSVMTAIANDYGYEHVFSMQLQTIMRPGDVVVAISASGNSPNVLKAVRWANDNGGVTVGVTGFDGGELRGLAHTGVHVPTAPGEYGPVEDAHMVLDHLVGAFLQRFSRTDPVASP